MPIEPASATSTLDSRLKGEGIDGSMATPLASGIANGLVQHIPSLQVQTTAFGLLGGGTGTGSATLSAAPGVPILQGALESSGIEGALASNLARACASGLSTIVQSGTVNTIVTGVASGSGNGGFSDTRPSSLVTTLRTTLRAAGMEGHMAPELASGLGNGMARHLRQTAVTTLVTGSPVFPPSPSSGFGSGSLS